MSTVDSAKQPEISNLRRAWLTALRHRVSVAWLSAAAIVMVAAFACMTIQVRESVFDATQLQVLVAALSSIAASSILMALHIRAERWHISSWITVTACWCLILILT